MYRLLYVLAYCIVYLSCIFSKVIIWLLHVNYVQSTCTECMSCYVMLCYIMLCYAMVGCCAVPCPKNVSAQSDPVSFCASDNKRLVTCDLMYSFNIDTLGGDPE